MDHMEYVLKISPFILSGLKLTAKIYVATMIFALPLGILAAVGKAKGPKILKKILFLYTWIWRGTPLLLQLFFMFYGLPIIGIRFSPFVAATITYTLNSGAYLTEIFRGGIESIDKGQYEAAKALGISYPQTMRRIIIPQTVRRVLPPTCSEAVNLVKDTALLAVIGMPDLLRIATQIFTRDFNIIPFIVAFVLYLIVSSVLVKLFGKLEKKYSIYE
ncbi:amine acid ABC transporter, permease protein, 3-TM region, His/Glu/Gln/Arg/opine family [Desulfosporosinus orientis DSM 765]|uniref:Amine acid ABC transporter, permease protein, 3-TM region, His/Glu/Gln/Arg/opine family n=1 Tax=Desulfosporosinus orientis (strain ATCC 19365 / DSM 765 / NCIMB 8382 / VKM B-1628 / Singapore I) TaxID=768706 RepID=G7W647_DESOD|nr:amino acid ABC transporter permease [Desulfosporosinus orientis]AET67709.1 amine acid ABC transporter, permease protein, 3-TM region, His/Glu/Gln/Arg/opine family [Desulfosporosinus orientis DSM 765]